MWQTITINYKLMISDIEKEINDLKNEFFTTIVKKMSQKDKEDLYEMLKNNIYPNLTSSKASADWKNYETACEEPKIPAPKFKVWSEVVFDYDNKNLTPVYIKIWSVTYSDKTKKWIYNFDWERAIEEEDLRHAIIPEVIQYFRP